MFHNVEQFNAWPIQLNSTQLNLFSLIVLFAALSFSPFAVPVSLAQQDPCDYCIGNSYDASIVVEHPNFPGCEIEVHYLGNILSGR